MRLKVMTFGIVLSLLFWGGVYYLAVEVWPNVDSGQRIE